MDRWAELGECVRRKSGRGDGRITVDDSKKVFDRKKGIAALERPVLAFASSAGLACGSLRELLSSLGATEGLASTVAAGDDRAASLERTLSLLCQVSQSMPSN